MCGSWDRHGSNANALNRATTMKRLTHDAVSQVKRQVSLTVVSDALLGATCDALHELIHQETCDDEFVNEVKGDSLHVLDSGVRKCSRQRERAASRPSCCDNSQFVI